ncbi:MAG TPA: penicillin-insensitive murein endopeptidase [Kofleriaceae bacterium]
MRSLVAVAVIASLVSTAQAKPKSRHAAKPTKSARAHADDLTTKRSKHFTQRAVRAPFVVRGDVEGLQSLGFPWQGKLHAAAALPPGDGYVIRRPYRAFGTQTTVDFIHHALVDMREQFPEAHAFAVGDISQEDGGQITQHRSHQSGRDVDIGLIYKEKPASFPEDFIKATADNLDCEATYAMLNEFAETATVDGGAQIIFLDYNVQGLLYHWAKDHGEDENILQHLFQYPERTNTSALVRHIPNHDNHMHVRFKCPKSDTRCSN